VESQSQEFKDGHQAGVEVAVVEAERAIYEGLTLQQYITELMMAHYQWVD